MWCILSMPRRSGAALDAAMDTTCRWSSARRSFKIQAIDAPDYTEKDTTTFLKMIAFSCVTRSRRMSRMFEQFNIDFFTSYSASIVILI